jgi:zinc transporter
MSSSNDGLVSAFLLDGSGGGRALDWEGVHSWEAGDGVLWLHLDYCGEQTQE